MKTLLVHQGLFATLNKEELKEEEDRKSWMKVSAEIQSKAHNALILSLGDQVLREVSEKVTAIGIWDKLESNYMKCFRTSTCRCGCRPSRRISKELLASLRVEIERCLNLHYHAIALRDCETDENSNFTDSNLPSQIIGIIPLFIT